MEKNYWKKIKEKLSRRSNNLMRKICIFTSSRADYYLLSKLALKLESYKNIKVHILISGTHLLKKYGNLYREIKKNHKNTSECKIFSKDKKKNDLIKIISKTINIVGIKLKIIKPDIFVVLGDRFEAFAATISANSLKIPIAHISGGEITEGAIDDTFRHAITKLSNLHFVGHKKYKKRIIQLGENSENIFVVGGTGSEDIKKIKFLNKKFLENELNFKFKEKNLIVTIHPETINISNNKKIINSLFPVLSKMKNTLILFTQPNIDPGSDVIERSVLKLSKSNKHIKYFKNLGVKKYFSCIKYCDAVIGNSSSGITEVPSLKKYTINLGDRQKGRLLANSIITPRLDKKNISQAIKKVYSKKYQKNLKNIINPYYKNNTTLNIAKVLKLINLKKISIKKFIDLNKNENKQ